MRYSQKNRKDGKTSANNKNPMYFIKRITIIIFGYLLSSINLIVAGLSSNAESNIVSRYLIFIGIVMSFMAPISLLDNRKEMRGKLAASLSFVIYTIVCCMLVLLFSYRWMFVFGAEILVFFLIILIAKKRKKIRDDSSS